MRLWLQYHELLESTNLTAASAAAAGAPAGTVIVAERQSGGRGRLHRAWVSPRGGLWFSIILRPQIDPALAPQLTLLAGVAVAQAVRRLYHTDRVCIKWPNDLLLDGKKICGILAELQLDAAGGIDYAVLGIGLNVAQRPEDFPPGLRATAASLNAALGGQWSCMDVLRAVLAEFSALYEAWLQDSGQLLPQWKRLNCTLGRQVVVRDDDQEIFRGTAVDLDSQGALLVRGSDGMQRSFDFGEISIR